MSRTKLEQETVIIFNPVEPTAIITTADRAIIRQIRAEGIQPVREWPGHAMGINERFIVDKWKIGLATPPRPTIASEPEKKAQL